MPATRCSCIGQVVRNEDDTAPALRVDYYDPDCLVIMHRLEADVIQNPPTLTEDAP